MALSPRLTRFRRAISARVLSWSARADVSTSFSKIRACIHRIRAIVPSSLVGLRNSAIDLAFSSCCLKFQRQLRSGESHRKDLHVLGALVVLELKLCTS